MEYINLIEIYKSIENCSYCLVKSYPTDNYKSGQDVDIFCYDVHEIVRNIMPTLNKYTMNENYKVVIHEHVREMHCYVDIMHKGKIEFRFDIYGKMPEYKRINLKEGLFSSIVENANEIKISGNGDIARIKVASKIDDILIRYLEYVEYIYIRPDKIKHLEYILNPENEVIDKKKMFDKLHYYLSFPEVIEVKKKKKKGLFEVYLSTKEKLKGKSLKEVMYILKRKLRS